MLRAKPVARFIWDYRRMGVRFNKGPYMTDHTDLDFEFDANFYDAALDDSNIYWAAFNGILMTWMYDAVARRR